MEPTFDPASFKTARKDIKNTNVHASYKGHNERAENKIVTLSAVSVVAAVIVTRENGK